MIFGIEQRSIMPSILTEEQASSLVWEIIKAHTEKRIGLIRVSNDSLATDEVTTAANRGAIKELKRLIKSVEPREIQTKQPTRSRQ